MLAEAISSADAAGEVMRFDSPRGAYAAARKRVGENDRIVVFGSFHTVADVMAVINAAKVANRRARQKS